MNILEQIAIEIYDSSWLQNECKKICPQDKELREDLFQEIMLIILTFKPEGALQTAYSKGEHLPFIKKIIMNQFNSVTSPFYKQYRKFASITQSTIEIENEDGNQESN